jgi:hypothetical protein
MNTELKAVELEAELWRATTRPDGSVDWVLKVPEYCVPQSQVMLGHMLELVHVVIEFSGQRDNRKNTR